MPKYTISLPTKSLCFHPIKVYSISKSIQLCDRFRIAQYIPLVLAPLREGLMNFQSSLQYFKEAYQCGLSAMRQNDDSLQLASIGCSGRDSRHIAFNDLTSSNQDYFNEKVLSCSASMAGS